jgi:hypothetical protein
MPPKKKQQTITLQKVGNDYPDYYRKHCGNYAEKNAVFKKVVEEENWCVNNFTKFDAIDEYFRYREIFAQDRTSKELNDPHVMLVPAHEHMDIFKIVQETPQEVRRWIYIIYVLLDEYLRCTI